MAPAHCQLTGGISLLSIRKPPWYAAGRIRQLLRAYKLSITVCMQNIRGPGVRHVFPCRVNGSALNRFITTLWALCLVGPAALHWGHDERRFHSQNACQAALLCYRQRGEAPGVSRTDLCLQQPCYEQSNGSLKISSSLWKHIYLSCLMHVLTTIPFFMWAAA